MVGDTLGRGLLAGIEFVADRETRAPSALGAGRRAGDRGGAGGGPHGVAQHRAGRRNRRGPGGASAAFIQTDAEIGEIVQRLTTGLNEVRR